MNMSRSEEDKTRFMELNSKLINDEFKEPFLPQDTEEDVKNVAKQIVSRTYFLSNDFMRTHSREIIEETVNEYMKNKARK